MHVICGVGDICIQNFTYQNPKTSVLLGGRGKVFGFILILILKKWDMREC
jgi:hypothetical protein